MQLDGTDLEELLVRARHEYGSNVRIVKADKVRTGGFGGFFAREHYELSVEFDDETVDETDGGQLPIPTDEGAETGYGNAVAQSTKTGDREVSLLDLADAISDREVESRERQRPTPNTPFTPGVSSGPTLSTDGASFASILAGLTETVATTSSSASRSADVVLNSREQLDAAMTARPPMSNAVDRPREPARVGGAVVATGRSVGLRDLRALGMPRAMLPAAEDADAFAALLAALHSLPPAPLPPTAPGSILAVVGESEGAWDAAVQLARWMALDDRALVYLTEGRAPVKVAPARRVSDLELLPARVERWRKRPTPTLAVLDAAMSPKSAAWNRRALCALGAEATWLVVPATRKTDDVAQWARRLGHADALMVTDVDASRDPASVLGLGMPVAWLDGRPATPGTWAGLLVDCLLGTR